MYKEIIIIVLIVILILVGNVITQNYTKDTVNIMQENLNEIKEELEKKEAETNNIEEKIDKAMQEWKTKNNKLAYYLEHDELEKIESELTALNANILTEEYEQGRENLDRCYFLLEHIKDKETISLSNIFQFY